VRLVHLQDLGRERTRLDHETDGVLG
jgi:hypothetical protein